MGLFRSIAAGLGTIAVLSDGAAAQSVLERTPHLSGGWVGAPATIQFNFTHRFSVSDAPTRKVTNSPTFLLSYRLAPVLLVGMNYATSSDVAPAFPNEWEVFGRYARFGGALQLGYNQAARSVDGELSFGRVLEDGRARFFAIGRFLSNAYDSDTTRYAVGGGAIVRLSGHLALAGDVATLLERRTSEEVAWGAALQVAIPYTPHTLSLQVTNTNTGTLQGVSRGIDDVRGGFEFTIPFTLSRYFGRRRAGQDGGGAAGGAGVELRQMAFAPVRLEVRAGASVEFTNRDPLVHTVTATDGSWDSGEIQPGATWRRTFDQPGTYPFKCTPHPFMTGTIVVRP